MIIVLANVVMDPLPLYFLSLELFVVVFLIFEKCIKTLKETDFQYNPDYSVQSEFILNRLDYIFGFIFVNKLL